MKLQLLFIAAILLTTPLVWGLPKFWQGKVMMLTTLLFLIYLAPLSVSIMLSVATLQWVMWKYQYFKLGKAGLICTICLPLLPLLFYKLGHKADGWLIPLGLSYYAFRQIHVAFEIYKGQLIKPTLEEYFQYLLFLPVILVGPIHRMPEFSRSLRRRKWQASMFAEGMERILYGMVKITFFGNYLFSEKLPSLEKYTDVPILKVYIQVMSFTGNAYVQFAGFSDLAIGMGLLWGIRVIENFNHPFLATNMQEFWQRWHISLSSWCRDYVFHPIMAISRDRWVALSVSMLVLALWHEISINYILWGIFHAVLILLTVQLRNGLPKLSQFINHHFIGRWIGRIWVFHLFAFSCMLIGAVDLDRFGIQLNQLF